MVDNLSDEASDCEVVKNLEKISSDGKQGIVDDLLHEDAPEDVLEFARSLGLLTVNSLFSKNGSV